MQIQIPQEVEEIIGKLKNHGYEAYAVGGCVRDTLLGREPGDWDITTSAAPQQVKEVFPKTIDTGIQHGTVTIMINHVGYEVTTYRIDGEYEDGRHPKSVEFTSSLKEDLRRRDFTINAMAYSHETGIVDEFGGMEDLEQKVIRCVGCAVDRFTEDALRILRAIRFAAQLGFEIERETFDAIKKIAPNLVHVSKERIQTELTKLLLSPNPEKIGLVYETGISRYVSDAFHKVDRSRMRIDSALEKKKHIRWAAFLKNTSVQEADAVLHDLKLDNDTINKVKVLVKWFEHPLKPDKTELRRMMSRMDSSLYDDLLELKKMSSPEVQCLEELITVGELSADIRENGDCVKLKDLAVSGSDVIQAGVKPGKAVGEVLNRLLEMVLEEPSRNEKEYLTDQIKKISFS
ncbi:CCA tRNA nucleotidyltransferase [Clostridium sp. MCC353]|uniref:CCA tRNA nucleotidyltransferase n=1 Tax=Clostridium sp. MCC353 TaxID=2592646 RepID=UPI001C0181E1|nr:CCA tRNA nucleotidyltransferase [Clostridium sp. MCC353]MBT9778199.1 CCA tRNA nucleotidyltransferase [Clostridium sp. MCC353]